jgi:calcium channel MID1
MQLSPLQSRLAASLIASVLLLSIYFLLLSPSFALAGEPLDFGGPILDDLTLDEELDQRSSLNPSYQPEFALFDRSIIGRAPSGVTSLPNNIPRRLNIEAGTSTFFVVESSVIFGRSLSNTHEARSKARSTGDGPHQPRSEESEDLAMETRDAVDLENDGLQPRQQPTRTIFISANTCVQPQRINPDATTMDPPQLSLFVSTSPQNTAPGPNQDLSAEVVKVFKEGAVMYRVNASADVYFGISAPNVSTEFKGIYNFEVAASLDGWYHSFDDQNPSELVWVDSDKGSAILVTKNLTDGLNSSMIQQVMDQGLQYVMFAETNNSWTTNGVRHSFCGLQNYAQIAAMKNGKSTNMVTTTMTTRGPGNLPKQQFFFNGLNSSTSYSGILAYVGKSATGNPGKRAEGEVGGGGRVFRATQFETKAGKYK